MSFLGSCHGYFRFYLHSLFPALKPYVLNSSSNVEAVALLVVFVVLSAIPVAT